MGKFVSVVVCCYNMGEQLRECLESLENQSYDNKEVIVVNDGSTDDSIGVLQTFQDRMRGLMTVASNAANLGVAASRNVGIGLAKGDIIAFTDADCTADPDWLSELVKGYCDKDVAAVGGYIGDECCNNIWERSERGHNYVASSEGYVSYIQGCNMSFDARVLRLHRFNQEIKYGYEEAMLCDDLIKGGFRIWYNPKAKVHHKHRAILLGLLRQKYLRGYSSIWYRKRQGMSPMLKRHFLMLLCLLLLPGLAINAVFGYGALICFALVVLGLLRDERLYGTKSMLEVLVTLPVMVGTEMAHFCGALAGVFVFRILEAGSKR